ncbi:MAG: hypothetical protein WAT78_00720, partial [Rhizobiaceae bacterium]
MAEKPDFFQPLQDSLFNTATDAARRAGERRSYLASLIYWFETYLLPGQKDEAHPVRLADVFIPLRAYIEKVQASEDGDVPDGAERRTIGGKETRIVRELIEFEDHALSWLSARKNDENLLVVSAGPGLGKSSSLRALTARIAKERQAFPVFLPLQHLEIAGSLEQRIHAALQSRVEDFRFKHDLLS